MWQTYEAVRPDPGWYTALMRASATGQLSQEELLSARQTMTEEQYSSEFECDPFAAILGAYYGKDIAAAEAEGRITALPPEPGVPVRMGPRPQTLDRDLVLPGGWPGSEDQRFLRKPRAVCRPLLCCRVAQGLISFRTMRGFMNGEPERLGLRH